MPNIELTDLEWAILSDWMQDGLDYINENGLTDEDWEVKATKGLMEKLQTLVRDDYKAVRAEYEKRRARERI
jgi:hypothetical protein